MRDHKHIQDLGAKDGDFKDKSPDELFCNKILVTRLKTQKRVRAHWWPPPLLGRGAMQASYEGFLRASLKGTARPSRPSDPDFQRSPPSLPGVPEA
jgi:hypothetical protein